MKKPKTKKPNTFVSVRDLPDIGQREMKDALAEFDSNYQVCPYCDGLGYFLEEDVDVHSGEVTSVPIHHSEVLTKMKERGFLSSDKIKTAIEVMYYGRNNCNDCHGLGFVKKSRKKQDEKTS